MTRRKSAKYLSNPTTTRVVVMGEPLHSELAEGEILKTLKELRAGQEDARQSPEKYVSKAIELLSSMGTRTKGVLMLSDAIDAQADISDAIPLLKKYLLDMEPIAQDLAVAVILYHHFQNQSDSEIMGFLRHENPRFARNAVDYMTVRAFSGLEVSLFVPELIRMIYHNDADVARSAYNAVEAAAILSGDETAALYLVSVYYHGKVDC